MISHLWKIFSKPLHTGPPNVIITGEKVQLLCDHFLGRIRDFEFNPVIGKEKSKWLPLGALNSPIENQPRIFCYTHILKDLDFLIEKLKWMQNPFNLILHNSDYCFADDHLRLLDELPMLRKIFTQNRFTHDERVTPLPIGIANSMWPHGNLSVLKNVMTSTIQKCDLVYFNFKIETNRDEREECYRKILTKGIEFQPKKRYSKYLRQLSTFKYAICPVGNGMDTHRFWECLYLKVVPIYRQNPLVDFFAKDFPVIVLNNWEDLDIHQLDARYDGFHWNHSRKLNINFYSQLISAL